MILVDAHVHIHDCFGVSSFLAATADNFCRAAQAISSDHFQPVICLTESLDACYFDKLPELLTKGDWRVAGSTEPDSVLVSHVDKPTLTILAGRQIVTKERLEILALGTNLKFADGKPVEQIIEAVLDAGAIAVLPWGFGKWLGARGRLVERLLETQSPARLFLGDNSGRLRYAPPPAEFTKASQLGFRVLPGSDPFPFSREGDRAGRFGFCLDEELNQATPSAHLKSLLNAATQQDIRPYGRLEGPIRFVRNQLAMQLRGRP